MHGAQNGQRALYRYYIAAGSGGHAGPAEVAWAKRVIEQMGDGTGAVMIDGKMQDDASVKQCRVVVQLATDLAARDADLAAAYGL